MKIILNDLAGELVDKLENALINMVNVHTYIWEGTTDDVYKYEISVDEDVKMVNDREYTLEHVDVLYMNGYYMIEIMNARQVTPNIEIKANEVESIVLK